MNKYVHQVISIALIGMVFLSLSGCVTINLGSTPPALSTENPPQSPVLVESPTPSMGRSELTEATLLNAQYLSPMLKKPIQMVNGKFEGVVDGVELTATIQPGIQFGDLNADGISDAAFILTEDTGGSGVFVSLIAVYSRIELFQQAPGVLIDDRPIIDSMIIESGVVKLSGLVHGPNDPMVDPTTTFRADFAVFGDRLAKTRQTSAFGGGAEHLISIESPLDGEEVSGSFRLKGFMPIGPFENNLALQIVDMDGNQLVYAGFMVNAQDMGAPAVFDNLVELPAVPPGTELLVSLLELSMADGTPIAIDSVRVIVK